MFTIKVAGVVVGIDNRYRFVEELCRDYMVAGEVPDFTVWADEREMEEEWAGTGVNPVWKHRVLPQCESNCIYRALCLNMIDYGGFLMHSAVIETGGSAVAFAAKSGVGKTTHIGLWLERYPDVRIINGDKPIYRYFDGRLYACGTPWNGKERLGCNAMAPLKALCFLERAEENSIRPLSAGEAMNRLFHQLLLPKDQARLDRFLTLVDGLLGSTPCWLLRCNRNPEAAETARRGLLGGE